MTQDNPILSFQCAWPRARDRDCSGVIRAVRRKSRELPELKRGPWPAWGIEKLLKGGSKLRPEERGGKSVPGGGRAWQEPAGETTQDMVTPGVVGELRGGGGGRDPQFPTVGA